jgi:hypothetical protein
MHLALLLNCGATSSCRLGVVNQGTPMSNKPVTVSKSITRSPTPKNNVAPADGMWGKGRALVVLPAH